MIKKTLLWATLILGFQAHTIGTINGKDIDFKEIEPIVNVITRGGYDKMLKDQQKNVIRQALENLSITRGIFEKAKKDGILETKEYKQTYKAAVKQLGQRVANELWAKKLFKTIQVSDKAIKDFYDKNKAQFSTPEEVKCRHILVKTEKEAKDIVATLTKSKKVKKDFIKLAKEKSTGPSAKNGGDLGFFSKEKMVPEFANAAFALKKGQFTKTPVKTQFGFHVILNEDKKAASVKKLSEVKEQVKNQLYQQEMQKIISQQIQNIKSKTKIVVK